MAIITNYATLKTAVADYLARDDLTSFVPNFIQNCEGKLYRSLHLRNEETELNVPIGGGVAPIPYRFKKLKYAYIDQSPIRLLNWMEIGDLYRKYPTRTVSTTPYVISREGNHFIFGPGASDGTLKGIYYQKQRPLEATSQTTADEIIEDATDTVHLISQTATLTDAVYTFSIYAKRGTSGDRFMELRASSSGVTAAALFDLSNGEVNFTIGDQFKTVFIEDIGSDWYRCAISFDAAAESTTHAIYMSSGRADFQSSYNGDGTNGIYLWGAQSEPSPYPTTIALGGGVVDSGFKNLLTLTTGFGGADWAASDVTVNTNAVAPPIEIPTPTQNWYTANAPEVLLYGSLLEAAPFIQNDARIPVWKSFYDDSIRTLMEEERASSHAGPLQGRAEVAV